MRARIGIGLTAAVVTAAAVLNLATSAGASARAQQDFVVTGEVDGLYPGVQTTINGQVTNPQAFAIRVTAVTATVDDANVGCPGSLLSVSGPRTPAEIAAGATATVPLDVSMAASAPDACQDVTFVLELVASAVEADAGSASAPSEPPAGSASPVPSSPTGFAFTGASVAVLVAIGLALVGLGFAARRVSRRWLRAAA